MTDNWRNVVEADARYSLDTGDCLEMLRAMPDDAVDCCFTSPPYSDCRTYGVGAARKSADWAEWLRPIVVEMCRVSAGPVFLNVSDRVQDHQYQNGPEWLHADLTRLDGLDAIRPYIWVKSGPDFDDRGNGIPGSGGKHFHRNDYEPIYGYAAPGKLPPRWSDNLAFGLPPKCPPGGPMRARGQNGERKITMSPRRDGGKRDVQQYQPPPVSNAGNVIRVRVGGFNLGGKLAHASEAPMPLGVAERFVKWFVPPGGIIMDCFAGSGTTGVAALHHGRRFVGCDIRPTQVDLAHRRILGVTPSLFDQFNDDDRPDVPADTHHPDPIEANP